MTTVSKLINASLRVKVQTLNRDTIVNDLNHWHHNSVYRRFLTSIQSAYKRLSIQGIPLQSALSSLLQVSQKLPNTFTSSSSLPNLPYDLALLLRNIPAITNLNDTVFIYTENLYFSVGPSFDLFLGNINPNNLRDSIFISVSKCRPLLLALFGYHFGINYSDATAISFTLPEHAIFVLLPILLLERNVQVSSLRRIITLQSCNLAQHPALRIPSLVSTMMLQSYHTMIKSTLLNLSQAETCPSIYDLISFHPFKTRYNTFTTAFCLDIDLTKQYHQVSSLLRQSTILQQSCAHRCTLPAELMDTVFTEMVLKAISGESFQRDLPKDDIMESSLQLIVESAIMQYSSANLILSLTGFIYYIIEPRFSKEFLSDSIYTNFKILITDSSSSPETSDLTQRPSHLAPISSYFLGHYYSSSFGIKINLINGFSHSNSNYRLPPVDLEQIYKLPTET